MCQERSCVRPWGAWVWRNGLCVSSRVWTTMPGALWGSMVNTVKSLAWELVCIRALFSAHCSSSWCWKHCHASSALVCHGSFSMLMTCCSSQTPRRSVSPKLKLKAWKAGMESKGLRFNMKKTKFMVSGVDLDVLQKSGKYPCAVCCKGVSNDSIKCLQCKLWVRKRYSSITGWLVNAWNYTCPRCKGNSRPIDSRAMTQVDVEGIELDVEDTFCYLSDILCCGGAVIHGVDITSAGVPHLNDMRWGSSKILDMIV